MSLSILITYIIIAIITFFLTNPILLKEYEQLDKIEFIILSALVSMFWIIIYGGLFIYKVYNRWLELYYNLNIKIEKNERR